MLHNYVIFGCNGQLLYNYVMFGCQGNCCTTLLCLVARQLLYNYEMFGCQGNWGVTEEMEEEERRRRLEFLKSVIPTTNAKLLVLAQSYQVFNMLLLSWTIATLSITCIMEGQI